MADYLDKWPSKRGPISKIRPSDGCGKDAVPTAVERSYDFPELGVIWKMSVKVAISQPTGASSVDFTGCRLPGGRVVRGFFDEGGIIDRLGPVVIDLPSVTRI